MRTALTVVIPHYGDPAPTRSLLGMLERQEAAPVLQVVVVDDASPVPFGEHAGADVVRREANGGFGAAVNSGIATAAHDLVLVLNSDVEIGPRFLTDLLAAAEPWLPSVISPRVLGHDGEDAWIGRRFPTTGQQVVEWLTPLARYHDRARWHAGVGHDVGALGRTAVVDWVVGAAMLLPTAEFRAVGGFDERFHMNAEEVDLQRRLGERGIRSVVLDAPALRHSGGGSSDPSRRREWLVTSRLRYAEKWDGTWARRRLQTALSAATAANLAVNGVRRVAGRDLAPTAIARAELDLIWRRR